MGAGAVIVSLHHEQNIFKMGGMRKITPVVYGCMLIATLAICGIPPFAGFFSKIFIFMAAFKSGFYLLVFIALVNTVISLYYYLLVVKAMYINKNETPIAPFKSDNYTKVSLVICLIGIVGLGLASIVFDTINAFSYGL